MDAVARYLDGEIQEAQPQSRQQHRRIQTACVLTGVSYMCTGTSGVRRLTVMVTVACLPLLRSDTTKDASGA